MIINWGDAPFKAFITVTYPSGSCTVTGEGQSYSHSGGGTHIFTVKKKGTYTVTATNGSLTDSTTATVTSFGQTVTASTLKYTMYLIKNGVTQMAFTKGNIGWTENYSGAILANSPNSFSDVTVGYAYCDLSAYADIGFKTLTIDGYCTHDGVSWSSSTAYAYAFRLGIGPSYTSVKAYDYLPKDARGTKAVSISGTPLSDNSIFSVKTGSTVWDGSAYRSWGRIYNAYLTT